MWAMAAAAAAAIALAAWRFRSGDSVANQDRTSSHTRLDPKFRAKLERVYTRLRARGYSPKTHESYRSQARQEHLYAQGRTRPGAIVTHSRTVGAHGRGHAVDSIDGRRIDSGPNEGKLVGWGSWGDSRSAAMASAYFGALGEESEREGLTWGGRWTLKDYPHVEL